MTPNKVGRERPEIRLVERRVIKVLDERIYRTGMSIRQVAERSNMHRTAVTRLTSGKSNIELVEFLALCKTLGLNPAPLLQQCISGRQPAKE